MRGRLERAPAAQRKQSIARKQQSLVLRMINDVAGGVAGRLYNGKPDRADGDHIALAHIMIDAGNAALVGQRRAHAHVWILRAQLRHAADMVVVMVGEQNIGERPALLRQRRQNGGGFRRVDSGCRAGRAVVQEHAEIILETSELMNLELMIIRNHAPLLHWRGTL